MCLYPCSSLLSYNELGVPRAQTPRAVGLWAPRPMGTCVHLTPRAWGNGLRRAAEQDPSEGQTAQGIRGQRDSVLPSLPHHISNNAQGHRACQETGLCPEGLRRRPLDL